MGDTGSGLLMSVMVRVKTLADPFTVALPAGVGVPRVTMQVSLSRGSSTRSAVTRMAKLAEVMPAGMMTEVGNARSALLLVPETTRGIVSAVTLR